MLGLLSLPWTMTAELFPFEIRGIAQYLVQSMAHVLMFASVQSFRFVTKIQTIRSSSLIIFREMTEIFNASNTFTHLLRSLSYFLGGAYAVQWFFAVISICGFLFALLFLPETHNKTLADIEAHFRGETSKQEKIKEKFCEAK